jgi:uncharacterized protein YndB with AHSA1/START domain
MATQVRVQDTTVTTSIVVDADVERAFSVFTDGIDSWWDRDHTIGDEPLAKMVLEPFEGGRAYGIGDKGGESDWGRVLVYDRPHRVVIAWDITLEWKREVDPAKASEFEVRFTPQDERSGDEGSARGRSRTLVVLEHRHLDRHGEGWEAMRDAVASPGGWGAGLRRFAEVSGS